MSYNINNNVISIMCLCGYIIIIFMTVLMALLDVTMMWIVMSIMTIHDDDYEMLLTAVLMVKSMVTEPQIATVMVVTESD